MTGHYIFIMDYIELANMHPTVADIVLESYSDDTLPDTTPYSGSSEALSQSAHASPNVLATLPPFPLGIPANATVSDEEGEIGHSLSDVENAQPQRSLQDHLTYFLLHSERLYKCTIITAPILIMLAVAGIIIIVTCLLLLNQQIYESQRRFEDQQAHIEKLLKWCRQNTIPFWNSPNNTTTIPDIPYNNTHNVTRFPLQ